MYLSNLTLWNFRKFGSNGEIDFENPDLDLPFQKGVNLLIGENDSGKTAIIDALKAVLLTHSNEWIRIEHDDFFDDADTLRIECEFRGLEDTEAKNFVEWLSWEGNGDDAIPVLTVSLTATRVGDRILPYDVRAGLDDENYPLTAEARAYLRSTYLRPLRDAKSELIPKRNSRLSQILLSHDAFQPAEDDHMFVSAVKELNKGIESYFVGQDRDGNPLPAELLQGAKIKETIDHYLQQFSKKNSKFGINGSSLRSILESLCLLFEEGINLGLGSHNILCIASELLHLQKKDWTGIRLGLIEEIEAHLHPQVQLQVVETLHKVSSEAGIQLIFTTHSPSIASKIPLSNLIICQNGKVFPMGASHTMLRNTDYLFLERFLDVTKANMFFARGVIIVEGWAEEQLIPGLAKMIGINLTESGVSIVNMGNTAFLRYSRIFLRRIGDEMRIPVAVVNDVDIKPLEAAPTKKIDVGGVKQNVLLTEAEINTLRQTAIQEKAAKYTSQCVRGYISRFWTLEYCIARSVKLRKLFYKSVLMALKEQKEDEGVSNLVPYDTAIANIDGYFSTWSLPDEQIAFSIMNHILTGENGIGVAQDPISKAVIAQVFARNLMASPAIEGLQEEPSIKYLTSAIKYAATGN